MEQILQTLQADMGRIDMMADGHQLDAGGFEAVLIKKTQHIRLKVHKPEVDADIQLHVDYGRDQHRASYSLVSGQRLMGNLGEKYDRTIKAWIEDNAPTLKAWWEQNGDAANDQTNPPLVIAQLSGNDL